MKYLITFCSLLCFSLSFAQFSTNTILVGGNLSLSSRTSDWESTNLSDPSFNTETERSQFNFTIQPSIGTFISETLMLGTSIGYTRYDIKSTSVGENVIGGESVSRNITNEYSFSPFIRKYSKLSDKLYFTSQFRYSVGVGKRINGEDKDRKQNTFSTGARITPGLSFFMNEKWALTASIGSIFLTHTSIKDGKDNNSNNRDKTSSTVFGASAAANTFSTGLQFFINRGTTD